MRSALVIAATLACGVGACSRDPEAQPLPAAGAGGGAGAAGAGGSAFGGTGGLANGGGSGGVAGGGGSEEAPPVVVDQDAIAPINLLPLPQSVVLGAGHLHLSNTTRVVVSEQTRAVGEALASTLRTPTGYAFEVVTLPERRGDIVLSLDPALSVLGTEGYRIISDGDRITLQAPALTGLFYATVSLRQLLPAAVESPSLVAGTVWRVPILGIEDFPRFAWRGLSLDVARHFFGVEDVKRLIDLAAYHKLNRFHLHLTDDQGWRIQIDSWPNLTTYGGSTQVGGGPGGYYTKAQYAELVAHAEARFVTLIPEIDMPGHTMAALASYAELNEGNTAPPLYTGTDVGISSLMLEAPVTYDFVADVLGEVAAMTPGPYLHIGGDEADDTDDAQYQAFVEAVEDVVQGYGKTLVGWCEVATAQLDAGSISQHWFEGCPSAAAAAQGMNIVLSPAGNAYLDMKYTTETPIGHNWAGYVTVQEAYEWTPALPSVPDTAILGVEAALWTEFVSTREHIDYLVFPRLCGHAEIGWSSPNRTFDEYRTRLPQHGARLSARGVQFFRAPEITWLE